MTNFGPILGSEYTVIAALIGHNKLEGLSMHTVLHYILLSAELVVRDAFAMTRGPKQRSRWDSCMGCTVGKHAGTMDFVHTHHPWLQLLKGMKCLPVKRRVS